MHTVLKTVPLGEINVNALLCLPVERQDINALQDSIACCGLLQPPCLWRSSGEEPYIIICGSRRVSAVRNLGWQEVSAWVLDPSTPRRRLFECALHDNLAHRIFNPVEIAHALQGLLECFSRDRVISEWLPRFGLSASGRTLERCIALCVLEPGPCAALIAGSLTEQSARRLCSYSAEDRQAVFALMRQLHLSAGKQAELLECLEDLSRRDNVSLREMTAIPAIEQVCSDQRLNRVQKTAQVRRILRIRRFPRLCAAEERIANAVKELQLPQGIRLMPPPHFEGRTFKAEVTFTSADELLNRSRELQRAAGCQTLKRLCNEADGAGDCTGETRN